MDFPEVAWSRVAPVVEDALRTALSEPVDLGGSARSHVWRVRDAGSSYIVKVYRDPDDDGFAREAAALEALDGSGHTPLFLAAADDPQLVVMEDLGSGPSLADALLADDRARATRTLGEWAEAIARVHSRFTADLGADFADRLATRSPASSPDAMHEGLDQAGEEYRALVPPLGIDPEPALGALSDIADLLSRGPLVLTPGDACPDNNVMEHGRLRLIDFEGAQVRHPAWDVAYLRVPWPSCWCSWALPGEVVEQALSRYRECVGSSYTRSDAFVRDLDLATLAWSVLTPGWFLRGGLARVPGDDLDPRVPSRRGMIQHRLRRAAAMDGPPELTSYAADLHAALAGRWGVIELPLGPAWRGAG